MPPTRTESAAGSPTPDLWALLIGISDYRSPAISALRGCRNDVDAVRAFLTSRMGVPASRIRVLVDAEATRAGLLDALKSHLIDNDAIPPGSQILIHYSGHGSQMPNTDGSEPDGLDETIVPHDSRTGEVYDIPDKTLGALLDQLARRRGDNVTVILDCCHSGSGTRAATQAAVRRAPVDLRPPPADLDAELRLTSARAAGAAGTSGWAGLPPGHVLVAGCLDREEANEHQAADGVWMGALTHYVLEYLKDPPPAATYADLHAWVKAQVNARYPRQTPVCEGRRGRLLFDGAVIDPDPFITVARVLGDVLTLDAGALHGLREGARVTIYPAAALSRDELPDPLAEAEVRVVAPATAQAVLFGARAMGVSAGDRALVAELAYPGARQRVALLPADDPQDQRLSAEVRAAIQAAGGYGGFPACLSLAEPGMPATLQVAVNAGRWRILDDTGRVLAAPQDAAGADAASADAAVRALASIARYRAILDLANLSRSRLNGRLSARLWHCAGGEDCAELEPVPGGGLDSEQRATAAYDPESEARNLYAVEVINASELDVYPHVFAFNSDYSIVRLYPAQGEQDALRGARDDQPTSLFCRPPRSGLSVYLPGDQPGEERWDYSDDHLKVFATTQPCDLQALEQGALDVPAPRAVAAGARNDLERLLDDVTAGAGTRIAARPNRSHSGEDWGVALLPYRTERIAASRRLPPGRATVDLGDGLRLDKPEGFTGVATVAWLQPGRRAAGGAPPAALESLPDVFQPVGRAGTRNAGGAALVLTLEMDEEARARVDEAHPLRLRLPGTDAADVLPVAFDGRDYLLAGTPSGDPGAVDLVRLPAPDGGLGTRGLAHGIQMFFYKKIGRAMPQLGLRRAELNGGAIRYSEARPEQFKPGDRAALVLHGFLSESRWMLRDLAPIAGVGRYDHWLAFDYESYATTVEANGVELAQSLREACGFGAGDGVRLDVYAHGMGCLVARYAAELMEGGREVFDRLALAGAPHNGTALANLTYGASYLFTFLLNTLKLVPVLGVAGWMVKNLFEQGKGWADLKVDSDLARRLNRSAPPASLDYLVLAGDRASQSPDGERMDRLSLKLLGTALDRVFNEPNDGMVGRSSLRGVRPGEKPARVIDVACDHFGYFAAPDARRALAEWAAAG